MVWGGCFLCTGSKPRSPGPRGRRSRPACVAVTLTVRRSSLGVEEPARHSWGVVSCHLGLLQKHPLEKPFTLSIAVLTPHPHTHTHILFLGREVHNSKTKELTFVLLMIKCMKLSLGWIIFDIFCAVEIMRYFGFFLLFFFALQCFPVYGFGTKRAKSPQTCSAANVKILLHVFWFSRQDFSLSHTIYINIKNNFLLVFLSTK